MRRALSPLSVTAREIAAIDPAALHLRLSEANIPAEILPVVQAANRTMARLEQGYNSQREFTANAAHELRMPIAVLNANIETLPTNAAKTSLLRRVQPR